ncbi:MAG TPA: alpha/beta hydrolase [Acidobacteriaceae bacterium]|jgi:hypothetical protein
MKERTKKVVRRAVVFLLFLYASFCTAAGIGLANISLDYPRMPLRQSDAVHDRIRREFQAEIEDVSLKTADGVALKAWFIQPHQGNGKSVILLHGIGGNRIDMSGYADTYLRNGYSVLLPDSRDHGESGGTFISYGILERDDVRLWVEYLRARVPGCTYLLGESLGAAIGVQATAIEPQLCAAAVESPFATFRQVSYERMGLFTHTGTLFWETAARPILEVAILYSRLRWGIYLPNTEPMKAVRRSGLPTLLIAGTEDHLIPMHHAQELYRACPSHCALWIVHGADHGGASRVAGPEFDRRILEWFAQHDK